LSIVRFRTVVRDTQDTAFVIFAVVVGMSVGARDLVVAGLGIVVVGFAAILMRPRTPEPSRGNESGQTFLVSIRVGLGHDIEALVGSTLDKPLEGRHLVSMQTAKQGTSIDVAYRGVLRPGSDPESLVKALNRLDGVQNVELALQTRAEN
jgi:hypothetical protein